MEGCAVAGLSVIRKYISSKNENTLRCKMFDERNHGNVLEIYRKMYYFCTEEASIDNIVHKAINNQINVNYT